jgi:adenylate cyclase
LGRFHDLFVIAHASSALYKGRTLNIREIGRELGVRYVVTGSIRKFGGRIRIATELADSVSGNNLWAEHYDHEIENVLSVQDEVTRTIVATVTGRVRAEDLSRALHKTSDNLAAYDLLLHGRHCLDTAHGAPKQNWSRRIRRSLLGHHWDRELCSWITHNLWW